MALVQTVDFFTPTVNDPYRFGQIAAANALSDVYAMGGTPLCAMNIVCFPAKTMPGEILADIMRGGLDKMREAGAALAGGHSVEDSEIKYGLAVSGTVDPERITSNRGAKPGDVLILTKPIGTGVLATAVKAEWEGADEFEEELFAISGKLNKGGGHVIRELRLRGATDITGFGLGGHLLELAEASGVRAVLRIADVPFIPAAIELAGMGLVPEGSICNRNYYKSKTAIPAHADPILVDLVFDAQTSGGLILCVPESQVEQACAILKDQGDLAAVIGRMEQHDEGPALVLE